VKYTGAAVRSGGGLSSRYSLQILSEIPLQHLLPILAEIVIVARVFEVPDHLAHLAHVWRLVPLVDANRDAIPDSEFRGWKIRFHEAG
jgi:hypothetical protein